MKLTVLNFVFKEGYFVIQICSYTGLPTKDEQNDVQFKVKFSQGYNARKVFSEVCASFVLQCNVSGR